MISTDTHVLVDRVVLVDIEWLRINTLQRMTSSHRKILTCAIRFVSRPRGRTLARS